VALHLLCASLDHNLAILDPAGDLRAEVML
jgi:hypothetical protein